MNLMSLKYYDLLYFLMQIVPVIITVASGRQWYAIATLLWGSGNIVAYLASHK